MVFGEMISDGVVGQDDESAKYRYMPKRILGSLQNGANSSCVIIKTPD